MKLSLIKFFDCYGNVTTGNVSFSFRCILKATNLKVRLWNQDPVQGRIAREIQKLVRNFSKFICNIIWRLIQIIFVFENVNYPLTSTKEEKYLRCQLTKRILCLTERPWELSQNWETWQVWCYVHFFYVWI